MELYYHCGESGSGHREQTSQAVLKPDGEKSVLLTVSESDHNAIKNTMDKSESKYSISVDQLIELIKKHGKAAR
jgi:hypothetical protein